MTTSNVTIGLALLAGLASFVAPCVLPLVPAYLGYLSGHAVVAQATVDGRARRRIVGHAVAFVVGFSVVFVLMGTVAGSLGHWLRNGILRYVGGSFMVLFGLTLAGVVHLSLFERGVRITTRRRAEWGYLSSLVTGLAFGAGWTPCIGPVLASILILSADQATAMRGLLLLLAYSAGLGLPFVAMALLVERARAIVRRLAPYQVVVQRITGVAIVAAGILLITDGFGVIGQWLGERGIGWELGI